MSAFEKNGYDSLTHLAQSTPEVLDEIAGDIEMKVFFHKEIANIYISRTCAPTILNLFCCIKYNLTLYNTISQQQTGHRRRFKDELAKLAIRQTSFSHANPAKGSVLAGQSMFDAGGRWR